MSFWVWRPELLHSCSERQKKQSPCYSMETFYEIKSTAKPSFHQIQQPEVLNRILGTSLSNSEVSSPRLHLSVYLEISRALKHEINFSSWNMKLSSELLPRSMEQKDGASRVAVTLQEPSGGQWLMKSLKAVTRGFSGVWGFLWLLQLQAEILVKPSPL